MFWNFLGSMSAFFVPPLATDVHPSSACGTPTLRGLSLPPANDSLLTFNTHLTC